MTDRELGEQLVQAATAIAAEMLGGVDVEHKGTVDVVTEADRRAESELVALLHEYRPGDGVVGEEGTNRAADGSRRWVLDPVDGTFNYAHGVPLWCSAVALLDGDEPLAAAVHDRVHGELFSAAAGDATTRNGRPLPPLERTPALPDAAVATVIDARRRDPAIVAATDSVARQVGSLRSVACGSLELAWVACGRLHAWIQPDVEPWDWHPGAALVRGAGGTAAVAGRWHIAAGSAILWDELAAVATAP